MGVIYTNGLFYALFRPKTPYQFTPHFNLHPLIFGLKPFGWLRYITIIPYFCLEYYFLFTSLWFTRTIFNEHN
jgi:hypothetical protein